LQFASCNVARDKDAVHDILHEVEYSESNYQYKL